MSDAEDGYTEDVCVHQCKVHINCQPARTWIARPVYCRCVQHDTTTTATCPCTYMRCSVANRGVDDCCCKQSVSISQPAGAMWGGGRGRGPAPLGWSLWESQSPGTYFSFSFLLSVSVCLPVSVCLAFSVCLSLWVGGWGGVDACMSNETSAGRVAFESEQFVRCVVSRLDPGWDWNAGNGGDPRV